MVAIALRAALTAIFTGATLPIATLPIATECAANLVWKFVAYLPAVTPVATTTSGASDIFPLEFIA